jgi:hypothetical protein
MTLEGTVVNGSIVIDDGSPLPEGGKVLIDLMDDLPEDHPLAPYDRAREMAILRDSFEDMQAGRGTNAREFLKELASERGLPFPPGE